VGHGERIGHMGNVLKRFVTKPEGKRLLERPRR